MMIRPVEKKDLQALAVFLEKETDRAFLREVWEDRFDCFWDRNPGFVEGRIPRGWLLLDDDDHVGGFFGNIPAAYAIDGQEEVFCSATSWFVRADLRSHSLSLLQRYLAQGNPLLDTTPNPAAEKIIKHYGFSELSQPWITKDFVFPVHALGAWNLVMGRRSGLAGIMMASTAALFCGIFRGYQKIYDGLNFGRSGKKVSVREITQFGQEYDAFWEKFRKRHPVTAVRDAARLNWFFFSTEGLRRTRKVFEVRNAEGLVGYAAVKVEHRNTDKNRVWIWELVDVALLDESEGVMEYVTAALLEAAMKSASPVAFVRVNSFFDGMTRVFRQRGFIALKGKSRFFYRSSSLDQKEAPYYATPLDGDRCFFP